MTPKTAGKTELTADPFIVQTWVTGWTIARKTSPLVQESGALRVDVGLPRQRLRYVFPHCSQQVRQLAEAIEDPWIYLKVCASPEMVKPLLPPRWIIDELHFMMTLAGSSPVMETPLAENYSIAVTEQSSTLIATVKSTDDEVVASGCAAFAGEFAIYDRIETHAHHRRRGLGTAVMRTLQAEAHQRGIDRGVLVATGDGRPVYERLGWEMHSLYTSAFISD